MFSLMTCIKFDKFQSYADPGIFVRGGPGQCDKKALTIFFSPQFILLKSNGKYSKKTILVQGSRGMPTFSRGGGGGGGVQLLIHYKKPI